MNAISVFQGGGVFPPHTPDVFTTKDTKKMGALKKCVDFARWIAAQCPYCLESSIYQESTIKKRYKNGDVVIQCDKCEAEFRIGKSQVKK